MSNPIDIRTPLLRLGRAAAKLESLRGSGGVEDRLFGLWTPPPSGEVLAVGAQGAALAAAAWARRSGVRLRQLVWGPLTHEARKALEIWGLPFEHVPSREQALARAQGALPALDSDEAVAHAAGLVAEVIEELRIANWTPAALVAPAGARAPLLAFARALPDLQIIAVTGPPELPDLAAHDLHGVQLREVSRAFAASARRRLSREQGLLVSHASAAAIALAEELGGVALVTANGEREFSLDAEAP